MLTGREAPKVRATLYLSAEVLEQARNAAVHLAGHPARLTLTKLAENALWAELERLKRQYNGGRDFPPRSELHEARNRVAARHPKTKFVYLHMGNDAEDLAVAGAWLDRYPNVHVDIAARLGELGRQPRGARKFFERYQDRMVFGTDATWDAGKELPQQDLKPEMYRCYFRFLETDDEYFDYAPSEVPPQGRWKIYGIALPDGILKKVYHNNAARLLGLQAI